MDSARATRRVFARPCLDWTERRSHLAGAIGAAVAAALVDGDDPWFARRSEDQRGLRVTEHGERALDRLTARPVRSRPAS